MKSADVLLIASLVAAGVGAFVLYRRMSQGPGLMYAGAAPNYPPSFPWQDPSGAMLNARGTVDTLGRVWA